METIDLGKYREGKIGEASIWAQTDGEEVRIVRQYENNDAQCPDDDGDTIFMSMEQFKKLAERLVVHCRG